MLIIREGRGKSSKFFVQSLPMTVVLSRRSITVQDVLVEDWVVHRGGAFLGGCVHRCRVVQGWVVDEEVGYGGLQRGGDPWVLLAWRGQHEVLVLAE